MAANARRLQSPYVEQAEGVYLPAGMKAAPEAVRGSMPLGNAVVAESQAQGNEVV